MYCCIEFRYHILILSFFSFSFFYFFFPSFGVALSMPLCTERSFTRGGFKFLKKTHTHGCARVQIFSCCRKSYVFTIDCNMIKNNIFERVRLRKKTRNANAKLNYFSIQVVSYTPPNKHVDTKDSSNEIQGNALRPVGVHNSVR